MGKIDRRLPRHSEAGFAIIEALIAVGIIALIAVVAAQFVGDSARQRAQVVSYAAGTPIVSSLIDELSKNAFEALTDPLTSHNQADIINALKSDAWTNTNLFDSGAVRFSRSIPAGYPFSDTPCAKAINSEKCKILKDAMARCKANITINASLLGVGYHTCFLGSVTDTSKASYFSKHTGQLTGSKDVLFAELSIYLWNFATNTKVSSLGEFYDPNVPSGLLSVLTVHWSNLGNAFHQTIVRQYPNNESL